MQRTRRGSYNRGRGIDGRSLLGGNQPGGNLLTEEQRRMVEQQQMLLTMQAMNQQEQASMFSPSLSTLSLANLMPTRGAAPTMVPPPLMALQHLSAPAPVPSPNSLYKINPNQLLSNMSSRERTRDEESASWKGREYDNNIKAGRGLGRQQRQQENSIPACRGSDQENNWNKPQVWTDSWDYRTRLSDEDKWTRSDNRKPPTWQDKTPNSSKEQPSWPSKPREFEEQRWTTDKLNQQEKTRGSRPEQSVWPSKSREAEEKRWTPDKPKAQDKAGVSRQDQTAWPSKSRESEEQMWSADKQQVEGRWTEWPKSETQSWPTRSVGDNWTLIQEKEKWSKMSRDPEEIWSIRNTEDPKAQTGWIGRQSDGNARMKRPREQMERPWMEKLDQESWNKNVTEPEKRLWMNKSNETSWDKLSVEPPVQDWGKKPKLSKDREEKNWSERSKMGEDQRWIKRSNDLSSAQHQEDTWTKNLKQDTDRWVDRPRKGDESWNKQSNEQEVRVWNQNPIPTEQVNWMIKGIGDRSIGEHDQQIWMGRDGSSRGGETVSNRAKSSDVWTDGHIEQLSDKLQVDSNNFLYPDLGMMNNEEVWSRLNKKNGDSLRLSESSAGRALVGGNEDWGERGDGLAGWLDGERGQVWEGDVQEVPWVEHRMGWLNSQLELVDRRMGQLDDRQLRDLPPRDLTEVWENQGTSLETRVLGPGATTLQQQNEGRESDLRLLLRSKRTRTEPDYGGWKENMVVVFPWTRKTKLGPRDMAELRHELITLIHGLLEKKDSNEQPRFFGTGLVSPGWFLVDCADKTSADWLITTWKPTIRNKSRSRLIVGLARDAIRVTFVGIYLKGVSDDIRLIESRLHSQNPIFKVNTWRRGPYKKTPSGMSITYLVDDAIIKLFLQYTWHIYYELAKVRIRSLEHKPIPPLHVLRF